MTRVEWTECEWSLKEANFQEPVIKYAEVLRLYKRNLWNDSVDSHNLCILSDELSQVTICTTVTTR
jgi:hypothetical protein